MSVRNSDFFLSAPVGADLSAKPNRAVAINSSGQLILPASAGDDVVGFTTEDVVNGTAAGLYIDYIPINAPGTVKAMAGAALAIGDLCHASTDGKLIKASTAANQKIVARVMETASGDSSLVQVMPVCMPRLS